jgi:hypothetical protein
MFGKFGISDSLLNAVKNVTKEGKEVSQHRAFGYTTEKKMDPVGKADADIDNDGDVDKSDSYLKNRRKAIKKSMGKESKVVINPEVKEEVQEIEEVSKKTLGSYIKKATGEVRGNSRAGKDFERDAKAARSDKNKNINNRISMNFSKRAAKRISGIETAADKLAKEETKVDSGLENPHNCATHVYSEQWGDGRTVTTMHADPDEYGQIDWYDVIFEHGIEQRVPIEELKVLKSSMHGHKKRGK